MPQAAPLLALLPSIGGPEYLVIAIIGLLIFGRRLPEVGRSLGKGIVEFKRGVQGLSDEVETASSTTSVEAPELQTRAAPRQLTADEAEVSASSVETEGATAPFQAK